MQHKTVDVDQACELVSFLHELAGKLAMASELCSSYSRVCVLKVPETRIAPVLSLSLKNASRSSHDLVKLVYFCDHVDEFVLLDCVSSYQNTNFGNQKII